MPVGELPAAAGFPGDLDAMIVHVFMMVPAQQDSFAGVGVAVVTKPVLAMVAFAQGRWRGAAGVLAMLVAGDNRPT
ncbi:MAG: hypothetical protein ACOH2F_21230, partial [Cellulomonas sp.]